MSKKLDKLKAQKVQIETKEKPDEKTKTVDDVVSDEEVETSKTHPKIVKPKKKSKQKDMSDELFSEISTLKKEIEQIKTSNLQQKRETNKQKLYSLIG